MLEKKNQSGWRGLTHQTCNLSHELNWVKYFFIFREIRYFGVEMNLLGFLECLEMQKNLKINFWGSKTLILIFQLFFNYRIW
jgi:hypothetical protein